MAPEVGRDFGGFRIDGVLGRGGMGVVFRAWQHRMQRPVALKVLPPEFAADADYRGRFAREAAALTRLDSPHVVTVFDHGEIDGSLYLAMQLVDGPDLAKVLAAGPLPPSRALTVVDQVASALGDAHAVGVIHRDVKTGNVLLRPRSAHHDEDFAYLCDFGIARSAGLNHTSDNTDTAGIIGTLGYMAPERLHGDAATAASDVYALGCLLWTTLTGSLPYQGSQPEVIMAHTRAPVPQLVADDPRSTSINELLAAMLAKDPAQRPSVRELRERIRAVRGNTPARALPAPAPSATARPAPARPRFSRRWAVTAAVVLVLVLAGVATFLLWPGESAADRIARATPAGMNCTAVAPAEAAAQAQVVCRPGATVGELRISAFDGSGAAAGYLRTAAGIDPAGLTEGRCPDDLPARQSWSRDGHGGTLVCAVLGTTTRYAWADDELATVSILDGQPGIAYPADLRAVDGVFTALRYG